MSLLFIMPSCLGDTIFATGLLDYVLTEWSPEKCTLVMAPPVVGLFEDLQDAYSLPVTSIPFKKRSYHRHWIDLWRLLPTQQWSHVVDLRGSLFSLFLFSQKLIRWKGRGKAHSIYEAMGKLVGQPALAPVIRLTEKRKKKASQLLESKGLVSGKQFLCLAPFSNWVPKDWPLERYVQVCKGLPADFFSQILVLGLKDQESRAAPLLKALGSRAVPFFELASLLDVAAVIEQSKGLVGGDSGLLHLAAAVGRPTVGLHGPSNEVFYGAWNGNPVRAPEPYKKLLARGKETGECVMEGITVEAVLSHVKEMGRRS